MAAQQLKKLAQSRANNHIHHNAPHKWIDYMPRHWSAYTLIFSTASLLLFCFLFYDMQHSPTSLLVHAGRQMEALKAQVGDSYFFSTTAASRSGVVAGHGSESEQKVSLSEEDLELIKTEFEDPNDALSAKDKFVSQEKTVLETVVKEEVSEDSKEVVKSTPEDLEASTKEAEKDMDSPSEQNNEDAAVDDKRVEELIADAVALEEASSESAVTDATCDWSLGKWVYDDNYYPLYQPNTCPFVDGGFRCVENGRPSSEFQNWRWQPHGCDLPRFDAKDVLERLRGKRMVFVGDSIGRNNWESMLCMLSDVVTNKSRVYEVNGEAITKHSGFLIYRFEDYDCTVEYYRSPHLVPQGRAPPRSDPKVRSTLKLDVMDWSSSKWNTADIVILNTGHWWTFEKTVRAGNFFQEKQTVHMNMSVGEGFTRAMQTVARYVEETMDPSKSQVFFRSYAPVHFHGGTWDHGGHCHSDEKPLQKFPFIWEDKTPNPMISTVTAKNVKNPISFLNITYLSDLRPDGHSSMYQSVPPSPVNHQDCSHWCLPGVPDTWNEILLATLLKNGQGKWGQS